LEKKLKTTKSIKPDRSAQTTQTPRHKVDWGVLKKNKNLKKKTFSVFYLEQIKSPAKLENRGVGAERLSRRKKVGWGGHRGLDVAGA